MNEDCSAHSLFSMSRKKNHSLEANTLFSFEHTKRQKDWDKNQPVFLRWCATLWKYFSWLQEKTKFRCHIQSRNFIRYLKPYYPREARWGKNYQFLICYIFTTLPLVQKFKIQMLLPILFLTYFCLREGKHKAGDQPHSNNTTWNCKYHESIDN